MQMIKLQDIEEMVIKMFDDEAPPNLYFHNSSLVRISVTQVELHLESREALGRGIYQPETCISFSADRFYN